jgi:hypothetical protein
MMLGMMRLALFVDIFQRAANSPVVRIAVISPAPSFVAPSAPSCHRRHLRLLIARIADFPALGRGTYAAFRIPDTAA